MGFFASARVFAELSLTYAVENNDRAGACHAAPSSQLGRPPKVGEAERDFGQVSRGSGGKDATPQPASSDTVGRAQWPPIPDLFDVITYFRARGDSFALIASIGFWVGEHPTRALTARGLKLWYEAELERRSAAKAAIR
jgi:hypothetical protein